MKAMQLSLDFSAPQTEVAKVVAMGAAADRQLTPGTQVRSMSYDSVKDLDEVALRQGLSDLFMDADDVWCNKCPFSLICDRITCQWSEEDADFLL